MLGGYGRPVRWHHGLVRPTSRNPDRPILITEAPVNADDEYNQRRKRYLIMMIIRALCVIGAASTFRYSGWLAAAFIPAAVVLPWSAVLIANNRPPKQALKFRRFLPGDGRHELNPGPDPASQTRQTPASERTAGKWTDEDRAAGERAAGEQAEQADPRIIDI